MPVLYPPSGSFVPEPPDSHVDPGFFWMRRNRNESFTNFHYRPDIGIPVNMPWYATLYMPFLHTMAQCMSFWHIKSPHCRGLSTKLSRSSIDKFY